MNKTLGVCGYFSTGSSAFVDILHEFNETQVLDFEFRVTRTPDGLEDLENNLRNPHSSPVSIKRFRKIMTEPSIRGYISMENMDRIVNNFLDKIIQHTWNNYQNLMLSMYDCFSNTNINYRIDLSIMPENFEKEAKQFVKDILMAWGIDYNNREKNIKVINQAFWACDPVRSFKYFENPMAVIVNRDPRDHYLFNKYFLQPKGLNLLIPFNNVDDYIKHYRILRNSLKDLKKRNDIMFFNFEELVYDCENTVKKLADFAGIEQHYQKGKFFKPTHSRNNTQLFKKYTECELDIKKIENELSEYIFPFEKYKDIESEGGMFYGSQFKKRGYYDTIYKFLNEIKSDKIVIFGAGLLGRYLAKFPEIQDNILFFIDNDTHKQNNRIAIEDKYFDVFSLDKALQLLPQDALIILAVSLLYQDEIEQEILLHGIKNKIRIFS